jgi:AhpD family alkylhydroperoxidase
MQNLNIQEGLCSMTKTNKKPTKKNKGDLVSDARSILRSPELSDALARMHEDRNGELGFLLKGLTVYKEPAALDRKTAELAAVSAAAALHCEHCLEAHMGRAVAEGASLDEIMDTILVAGAISESSMLSVAFRKYKQLEGKMKKGGSAKE